MAAMRPDICAEPMLRAPSPEIVSESTLTGPLLCGFAGRGVCAREERHAVSVRARAKRVDESRRESLVFMTGNPSPVSALQGRGRLAARLVALRLCGRLRAFGLGRFGLLRLDVRGVGRARHC